MLGFVFFKQKTAYEMRISDWSSDVCSSDLGEVLQHVVQGRHAGPSSREMDVPESTPVGHRVVAGRRHVLPPGVQPPPAAGMHEGAVAAADIEDGAPEALAIGGDPLLSRSEEHTSELQSLMRISYAVFCLKKKTKQTKQ